MRGAAAGLGFRGLLEGTVHGPQNLDCNQRTGGLLCTAHAPQML